ncbi:MAG: hypothetical protein Q9193_005288 [Seirophora villosa]
MEPIYKDFLEWEHKQQNAFIKSLAPDFRANLGLFCPDIVNLARCSNLASKETLAIKNLCESISTGALARLGGVCVEHSQKELPWSPLALAQDPAPGTPGHSEPSDHIEPLEERGEVEEKPEKAETTEEEKNVGSTGRTPKEKASSKDLNEKREEEEEKVEEKKEDGKVVRSGGEPKKGATSKTSAEESEVEPEKIKRKAQRSLRKAKRKKTR